MKEYRVCTREHGSEHTASVAFRDWGGRQNWQGNETDEEREAAALQRLSDHKKYGRIFYGIKECDTWLEVREVGPWEELASGGVVSESYIRPAEEGPVCPVPKSSVIFEGQKFTFDEEDSARFAEIVKRHRRRSWHMERRCRRVRRQAVAGRGGRMTAFLLGFVLGGMTGVLVMSLVVVSRED